METQNIANPSSTAASSRPTGTSSRSTAANTRSTVANTRSTGECPVNVTNTQSTGRPALRNLPHPRSNSNRDCKRLEINPKRLKTSHFTKF